MAAHMSRYPLSFSWDSPHPGGTPLTFGIWGSESDHVVRCPSSTGGFFLGRAAEFGEGGAPPVFGICGGFVVLWTCPLTRALGYGIILRSYVEIL